MAGNDKYNPLFDSDLIEKNLPDLDDAQVVDMLFKAQSAGEVDRIFTAVSDYSATRLETIAEIANGMACNDLKDTIKINGVQNTKRLISLATYDLLSLRRIKALAQICVDIHQVRGDSTQEPVLTFVLAIYDLPPQELLGHSRGITKAYDALIDKIAEELPPEENPAGKKRGIFGKKSPKP